MEVDPQILDDLMKNPGYEGQQANTTSEFYAESFSEVLAKSIGYFVTAEFLIGSNNLAADTAGRDHFIAGSKSVNHLLVFFLTFLLRTDQKEPENGKNEDHYAERREHAFKSAGLRSSARGCLCICFRNKQFKTPTMRYGFTEGSENFSTSTA